MGGAGGGGKVGKGLKQRMEKELRRRSAMLSAGLDARGATSETRIRARQRVHGGGRRDMYHFGRWGEGDAAAVLRLVMKSKRKVFDRPTHVAKTTKKRTRLREGKRAMRNAPIKLQHLDTAAARAPARSVCPCPMELSHNMPLTAAAPPSSVRAIVNG